MSDAVNCAVGPRAVHREAPTSSLALNRGDPSKVVLIRRHFELITDTINVVSFVGNFLALSAIG